jgi:hypothetical protein
MIRLLQKVWYNDGTCRRQEFEAENREAALSQAYKALDQEVERQIEERGRVTIVKALCDEEPIVDLIP